MVIEFVLCIRVAGSLPYTCGFVRATQEFRSSWGDALERDLRGGAFHSEPFW
jgi:hypothetical protein